MPLNKNFFNILLISYGFVVLAFWLFEGSLASAQTYQETSTTTAATTDPLEFDVTLSVEDEIRLRCPLDNVSLGNISGLTGGAVDNTALCNVATNKLTGYTLQIHATNSPAMVNDASSTAVFADYSVSPTYSWTNADNQSQFGFAIGSADAATAFKNDGGACGSGAGNSEDNCFRGFANTSDIQIASRDWNTDASGVTTTINFKAEVGNAKSQPSGTYRATVVVTATMQ